MRQFPLFAFSDGHTTVITRGLTCEQAMSYAVRKNGAFQVRGRTIFPLDHLPINAAVLYSENHDSGWLHRVPFWLEKLEKEYADKVGIKEFTIIILTKQVPVLLFEE